jgi:nitrogen fixation protein FixH
MKKKNFNPWPYGLAAVLIAFCVIQFSLVALASSGFEGLDDVEYYRHGVEYGQEIERQEQQRDLGWTIAHNLDQAAQPTEQFPLRIALLNYDQKPIQHAKLKVKIGRTATLKEDQVYEFKEVGPGIYSTDVKLGLGNWKLDLEAEKGEDLVKVEFRHRVGGVRHAPEAKPLNVGATDEVGGEQL